MWLPHQLNHKDLGKLVEEGDFRTDIYYRINVVKLTLPRLAERKADIPLLTEHFIERFNKLKEKKILGLSHEALAIFIHHDWPGNVRELDNHKNTLRRKINRYGLIPPSKAGD